MKFKQAGKTIFIVDDVVENLHLLTKMLTEKGYGIRAAKTGREAIASILNETPDLILLDIKLPDLSGFEVCKLLKENGKTKHVPVIFLSGLAETADKLNGFAVGGVDYITKPFIIDEVIVRVETHLEMSRLRQGLESTANELLRINSEDFKELFDKAPVGYHEIDAEGRIVRINETELNMLGYSLAEVVGEFFWQFDVDAAASKQAIKAKLKGILNPTESYERDFRRKDGTKLSVLVTDKLLKADDDRIIRIRSNVQDITERKQVQEALLKSENLFSQAFNGSPAPMTIARQSDGRYIEVNKSFLRMIEYNREDVIGKTGDSLNLIDSDARNAIIGHLKKTGNLHNIEVTARSKTGKLLKILTSIEDTEIDGEACTLTTMLDITERVFAEEELRKSQTQHRTIIHTAMDGFWLVDRDGKIIEANESYSKMSGYSTRELLQMSISDLEAIEKQEEIEARIKRVFKKGSDRFETRHKRKDGSFFDVEVSIQKQEDPDYVVAFFRDITARKLSDDALRKSEEKFKKAFMTSPDCVNINRLEDGMYVALNSGFTNIIGYTEQEILGKTSLEKSIWYDVADRKRWVDELNKNGEVKNFETRFRTKNGTIIYGLVSASIIELEGVKHVISMTRDITERKLSENALTLERNKLSAAFENQSMGFVISNGQGGELTMNETALHFHDFASSGEMLKKVEEYENDWELRYPDGRLMKYEEWPLVRASKGDFANNLEIHYHNSKTGRNWICNLTSPPVRNKAGEIQFIVQTLLDITEQRSAEKALKESEEKFRNIFEYSVVGMSITTFDGRLSVNKAFSDIVGYSEEELNRLTWQEITYKEDIELKQKEIDLLIKGVKKSTKFESRFVHKNGSIVWTDLSAVLQKDNDGTPLYFITSVNDITERKEAESALHENRAKLESALASMTDAVFISDAKGNFIEFNDAFATFHRFKDKAECSRTFSECPDILDVYYPNGEPASTDMWAVPRALRGEVATNVEYILRRKDTGESWVGSYSFSPILGNEGEIVGSVVVGRDITELKLAEKKLRDSEEKLSTLFSSMTEMVVMHELVFNPDNEAVNYRIIDCNNAFTVITGIKKEDAIGRLATDVYQTEVPPYFEIYAQVAITGKSYEYDSYYAPMDKHFIISVVSPRKNVFATITTDISAIKQIQDEITAKNKELENYLYIASHDLRSPLVNIQGFSQRLQKHSNEIKSLLSDCKIDDGKRENFDRITNEAIPKTLNFIQSNVLKMDSLINSLLQISRTGRLALTVRKVDMNELIKTIIAAQNYQLTELAAQVIIHDLSDCFGDENQLNQLFSNIIDNAIKYRDKNRQLAIEIESKVQFDKVVYSISDNGKGISPRNQEKIWDVFYRADPASETGDGIGLSIAKTITNKHKGKIWVESEENEGSTFYVELQLREFSDQ
jgi:PAS domain S-box-containing protein